MSSVFRFFEVEIEKSRTKKKKKKKRKKKSKPLVRWRKWANLRHQ